MAKSGLRHIDVGAELTKTEWESEESHEIVHGTSFPGSPVERQLFYRDDEHKWYIYDGTEWVSLQGGGVEIHGNEYHDPDFASEAALTTHEAATTGIHGVGASTVESASGSQGKVDTHAALTTGVHGLKGEVSFAAHQTSDQTIAHATNTVLNWHAKAWDVGGYMDLTNNWHLPLVAGKYHYHACIQLRNMSDGDEIYMMFYKNGVFERFAVRTKLGGDCQMVMSGGCDIVMNGSTDYVTLIVFHSHGSDRDTWGAIERTWFMGHLIPQST